MAAYRRVYDSRQPGTLRSVIEYGLAQVVLYDYLASLYTRFCLAEADVCASA